MAVVASSAGADVTWTSTRSSLNQRRRGGRCARGGRGRERAEEGRWQHLLGLLGSQDSTHDLTSATPAEGPPAPSRLRHQLAVLQLNSVGPCLPGDGSDPARRSGAWSPRLPPPHCGPQCPVQAVPSARVDRLRIRDPHDPSSGWINSLERLVEPGNSVCTRFPVRCRREQPGNGRRRKCRGEVCVGGGRGASTFSPGAPPASSMASPTKKASGSPPFGFSWRLHRVGTID